MMTDHETAPPPPASPLSFTGVEELEEANRAIGWNIEYRQLRPGGFKAEFTTIDCDGIAVTSECFNNSIHVLAEPPAGAFAAVLPRLMAGSATSFRREIGDHDLIVFPSNSEMEFITSGQIADDAIYLSETAFQGIARAIAPAAALFSPGQPAVIPGSPTQSEPIRRLIDRIRTDRSAGPELFSSLLASLVLWMSEKSDGEFRDRPRVNGAASRIARKARDFIELHYQHPVRMEDLCWATGAGLRTVQRSFAAYYQVTPTEYLRSRRLNAVRRELTAGERGVHSVAEIARASGFRHLGRFSADYRRHFGEPPSETLARRAGSTP